MEARGGQSRGAHLSSCTSITPSDGFLVGAALLLAVIRLGLGLLSYQTLRHLLAELTKAIVGSKETGHSSVEWVAWAVRVASRHLLRARTCLTQVLVAQVLLTRRGYPALLCLGVVRGKEGSLEAHAWLASWNRVVGGGLRLERYSRPLVALEGGAP
jgi:hypothetical protein